MQWTRSITGFTWLTATAFCAVACTSLAPAPCGPEAKPVVQDALYFGTATPRGSVSAEEFAAFMLDAVTPRFPQGLTTWNASGQWRGADGRVVHEASHVLLLVHASDAVSDQAVQEIIREYKSRFQQEAVLRVTTGSCASL